MKSLVRKIILFITLLFFLSCSKNSQTKKQAAGIISNDTIYVNEIDPLIEQQLYDFLYEVYTNRKGVLEEIVKERILVIEAKMLKISKEELLLRNVDNKVTDEGLKTFIKQNHLQDGLQLVKNKMLKVYKNNTEEGHKAYIENYKDYLKRMYIESLLKKHNFKILLEPPKLPKISLKNIHIQYKGNNSSKVTLLEISDLDCSVCKKAAPLYEKIFEKYKEKIKWGFVHFSNEVTLQAVVAEAAGKQGKFWEMQNLLVKSEHFFDTLSYYKLAENLNLNLPKFKIDLKDTIIHNLINNTILKLRDAKFYATPSIVVNEKIISNSFSQDEIEKAINEALINSN